MPVVGESADARFSAGAAGSARQYGGTLDGVVLCPVAVTLVYASGCGTRAR